MDVTDSNYISCLLHINAIVYSIAGKPAYYAQKYTGITYVCTWKGLYCTSYVTCLTDSDTFMQTSASSELWERCSCDSLPLLVFYLFQPTLTRLSLYMCLFAYLYKPMCYYEVLMSALFFSFSNCICWYYDWRFNQIYKEKGLIIL